MTYNNIINHLKLWCKNKRKPYRKYFRTTYVGSDAVTELEFHLSTLIDKPFESINDLKKEMLNFTDIVYNSSISKAKKRYKKRVISETIQTFCDYLEDVLSRKDNLEIADIPYERMIVGEEANMLKEKFYSVWGYGDRRYWYPLEDYPIKDTDKIFIMYQYFKPHKEHFEQIIGLPQTHMYCFGEDFYPAQNYVETNSFDEYYGSEEFYTDKDFTWAVYFSHESTVTFAGSIVPQVKELLASEKEHWNDLEWL